MMLISTKRLYTDTKQAKNKEKARKDFYRKVGERNKQKKRQLFDINHILSCSSMSEFMLNVIALISQRYFEFF